MKKLVLVLALFASVARGAPEAVVSLPNTGPTITKRGQAVVGSSVNARILLVLALLLLCAWTFDSADDQYVTVRLYENMRMRCPPPLPAPVGDTTFADNVGTMLLARTDSTITYRVTLWRKP